MIEKNILVFKNKVEINDVVFNIDCFENYEKTIHIKFIGNKTIGRATLYRNGDEIRANIRVKINWDSIKKYYPNAVFKMGSYVIDHGKTVVKRAEIVSINFTPVSNIDKDIKSLGEQTEGV